MRSLIFSWVLLLAVPLVHAQGQGRYLDGKDPNDPRVKRALRERAVGAVGPIARSLVETYGDPAVAAISACSKPVATKLAEFHASGQLGRMPDPPALLAVIGQTRNGDAVASFAMTNGQALTDELRYRLFLADPLTYALALRSLDDDAVNYRRRVEESKRQYAIAKHDEQVTGYIVWGTAVIGVLVAIRLRRRNEGFNL